MSGASPGNRAPDPVDTSDAAGTSGTVGIIGLGLMGGSLARDLAALGWRVQAVDRDRSALDDARDTGIVSTPLDPGSLDLLVLAVPVRAAPPWIRELGPELGPETVVTDLGSTKRTVEETAGAVGLADRFVGSHPMAGDHRSGWAASRAGLYRGARVWVCPAPESSPDAVSRVEALWRSVGATPERTDAGAHDRLMASASHGPQVVASALAGAVARLGVARDELGPGGRDTTRLAGSDPSMWVDILLDNADQVTPVLEEVVAELTAFQRAVRGLDGAGLEARLNAARAWSRGQREPDTAVAGVDGI